MKAPVKIVMMFERRYTNVLDGAPADGDQQDNADSSDSSDSQVSTFLFHN
jgi:hypothetical protein